MKGCLKFSSTPAPAHDSQGQHHNEHPEAHSYHAPTTTTPLSTTSCPATTASSSTDAAHTTTPSQAHTQTHRKCVAFCAEGSETVYPADEWDRTPAEPARKLSYQWVWFFVCLFLGLSPLDVFWLFGCLALCCIFFPMSLKRFVFDFTFRLFRFVTLVYFLLDLVFVFMVLFFFFFFLFHSPLVVNLLFVTFPNFILLTPLLPLPLFLLLLQGPIRTQRNSTLLATRQPTCRHDRWKTRQTVFDGCTNCFVASSQFKFNWGWRTF